MATYFSGNQKIESGGDITNLSPVEDGEGIKSASPGGRFDPVTERIICVRGTLVHQVGGYVFPSPVGAVLIITPLEKEDKNPKSPPLAIIGLLGNHE